MKAVIIIALIFAGIGFMAWAQSDDEAMCRKSPVGYQACMEALHR